MSTVENKEIVKKINESFSNNSTEGFLSYCADDIHWTMMGTPAWAGKDAIRKALNNDDYPTPPAFTVDNIIAENDMVVCTGTVSMTKKDGEVTNGAYCDMYKFQGNLVKEMTTYFVEFK